MATGYWHGATNGTWSTTTNWYTTIEGTTNVSIVPGAADTAFFNANGFTSAYNVYLNGSRAVNLVWLNGNAQGTILILGGTSAVPATQTLTINGNIDMSGSNTDLVFNSNANIGLGTSQNWSIGTGRTITVNSIVTNPSKLTLGNNGTIKLLNGGSTYSLGTDISSGWVQVGASTNGTVTSGPLGTGTVTMTGGKLSSNSPSTGYTLANALTLNGTMTLGDGTNTGSLTFSGALTLTGNTTLTASSGVTFTGAGTSAAAYNLSATVSAGLYFQGGAGTFAGGTAAFTGSTVFLANYNSGTPNQLAGFSTLTFNSDAQINGNTAHTFANAIGGTGIVYVRNTSASGITFNGSMVSYTGSLRAYAESVEGVNPVQKITLTSATQWAFLNFFFQSSSGLTTLSQTLSYTGTGTVNYNGEVLVAPLAGSHTNTSILSNDTGTAGTGITLTNLIKNFGAITSTFQAATNNGPVSISGSLTEDSTGTLNLRKSGGYALTLSGSANTYKGSVTVSVGTLNANSVTALGADQNSGTVTSGATLSLGAALNYSTRTFTINGTGVTVGGVLQGAVTHAYAGTAKIGAITLGSASYIRGTATGTTTLSSSITATSGALTLGSAASTVYTQSGVISSSLTLTVGGSSSDTGEVILSGVNSSLTGAITVNYGTLSFATQASVGATGTLTLTRFGTVAQFNAATTTNRPITGRGEVALRATGAYSFGQITMPAGNGSAFGGNALALTAHETATLTSGSVFPSSIGFVQEFYPKAKAGKTLTLQGVIDSLLNSNPNIYYRAETEGSVVVSGSNTYSGYSILYEGTIQAAASEAVGVSGPFGINTTSGAILMYSTGTLQYSASNNADYSGRFDTTGGERWKIDTNGQSVTFASTLQGAGSLVEKLGTGTLTLTAANTYTGSTTVTTGTLRAGNTQAFGTTGTAILAASATLQTLTTGGQNGKLTVAALNNSAGGIIKIGG